MNAALCSSYQQPVPFQQPEKLIPSHSDVMLYKERLQHDEQLPAATARLVLSDLVYFLQNETFITLLRKLLFVVFVIGLRRVAQQ